MFGNNDKMFKKKLLGVLLSAIICGFLWSVLLYLCLTDYNESIVEFMKSVAENNLELATCMILFPIIVIINAVVISSNYVVNSSDGSSVKGTKKRRK